MPKKHVKGQKTDGIRKKNDEKPSESTTQEETTDDDDDSVNPTKSQHISVEAAASEIQALTLTDEPKTSKRTRKPAPAATTVELPKSTILDTTYVVQPRADPPVHGYFTRSRPTSTDDACPLFPPENNGKSSTKEGPRTKTAKKSKKKESEQGSKKLEGGGDTAEYPVTTNNLEKDKHIGKGARPKEKPAPQKEESTKGKGKSTNRKDTKPSKEKMKKEKSDAKGGKSDDSDQKEVKAKAKKKETVGADHLLLDSNPHPSDEEDFENSDNERTLTAEEMESVD